MNRPALEEGPVLSLAPTFNGHSAAPYLPAEQFRFVNGKVHLSIPSFGTLEGKWEPEERERQAAWELYVELITCTALLELEWEEGMLRETLSSLDAFFLAARSILRKYGPEIARPNRQSSVALGVIAVAAIDYILGPTIAKWHPLLRGYENTRPSSISNVDWESQWEYAQELHDTLRGVRRAMTECADVFAQVAKVSPLHRGSAAAGGSAVSGHF